MVKNNKILIIGASAKDYSLAKKFKTYGCEVFVAPGNSSVNKIATCVDIREDNVKELLEFVLENDVSLTVVTSEIAINADIAELFQANEQHIFAPQKGACDFALSRAEAKKFLYKLKIQTPRFAIFDKLPLASDYLKSASMPQVIRTDTAAHYADRLVATTFSVAKTFVEDLFCRDAKKIVLEDYVYGHEFTMYVVTDGYNALPLATVANYKLSEDGDGGILTSGVGAFVPDYKVSKEVENSVMKNVVSRILDFLEKRGTPYLGILGIDCVLKEDGSYVVLDFKPFLSDYDSDAVLNLVDENLYTLFEACAVGSFADDYETLNVSDNCSVSAVISSRIKGQLINGLDLVESDISYYELKQNRYLEYVTVLGKNFVLTNTASTLSRACKNLYEDIDVISFDGKKYRSDICGQVEKF